MNLVVGTTGYLGSEICRRLLERGYPVRGLVRPTSDRSGIKDLISQGLQLAEGDLKDPASLAEACRGVAAVISTATSTRSRQDGDGIETVDLNGQLALVDTAKQEGVKRFIFVSVSGNAPNDNPLVNAKRTVEEHVRNSGMTYTILRGGVFMESWLSPWPAGFDYANGKATVFGSGRQKISWVSLGDVAEFAVLSLEHPAAENTVLEVGGPEALSPEEVIRIFEEIGGRRFEVQRVPQEALEAQRAAATDSMGQTFAALMLFLTRGDVIDMEELQRTFPVRLTSVRDYARQVLSVTAAE